MPLGLLQASINLFVTAADSGSTPDSLNLVYWQALMESGGCLARCGGAGKLSSFGMPMRVRARSLYRQVIGAKLV